MVAEKDRRRLIAEHPDLAVSEDFLNMEDPPAAKQLDLHWEPPQQQQKDRSDVEAKEDQGTEKDPEGNQHRVRARRGVPDFNRRPSFEYEDYKKNAYNRLSMFDSRH